jgi:hypothetical protein
MHYHSVSRNGSKATGNHAPKHSTKHSHMVDCWYERNRVPRLGRTFVFADPDGYRITANENPWDRFPLGGRKEH